MFDDGRLRFGVWTGFRPTSSTSPKAYNDGTWHHMVATQGSDGMKLYVDGELVGTNPQTAAQDYTGYWRVGGDTTWGGNSSNYFAGSIDEVAVYSKVAHRGGGQRPLRQGWRPAGRTSSPTAAFTSTVTKLKVDVRRLRLDRLRRHRRVLRLGLR